MDKRLLFALAILLIPPGCDWSGDQCQKGEIFSEELNECVPSDYIVKGGKVKVGKPYKIAGRTYVPQVNYKYAEAGKASWYGPGFHGKRTANGEKYNMHEISAAHRDLPIPSVVEVTNRDNGRKLIVRVADRGPFCKDRVIDLSARAAELLHFKHRGTANVHVRILEKESRLLAAGARELIIRDPLTVPGSKNHAKKGDYIRGPLLKTPAVPTILASDTHSIPKSGVYVQAASFSDPNKARQLKNAVKDIGDVVIKPVQVNEQEFYRVQVGPLNQDRAHQVVTDLNDRGHSGARIIFQ